jgi:hypothetical protein
VTNGLSIRIQEWQDQVPETTIFVCSCCLFTSTILTVEHVRTTQTILTIDF